MLERRRLHRRRVCLTASLTHGFEAPVAEIRLRNLSEAGAQCILAHGDPLAARMDLRLPGETRVRSARVVWRRMERFGVEFVLITAEAGDVSPPGKAETAVPTKVACTPLERRLRSIVHGAGRGI